MAIELKDALDATGTVEEKRLIQAAYRRMLRAIKVEITSEDKRDIRKAYEVAVHAHRKQRRKSGEPYILHPIAVATICAREIGLGPTAIVAALLHDVVEDTEVTLEEIRAMFGEKVASLVDGLTKLDGSLNEEESLQARNFQKVLVTLLDDVRVVLIKMADRMHNMRTLGSMPYHKQLKIAAETAYVYAPLAHRLGLYAFKTEYQDLCLKIQQPDAYQEVARKLAETKRNRNRYISDFIRPLRSLLDRLDVPYRIFGRPKSIYSIFNKINNKEVEFEEIYDLFAVRVVYDVPVEQEKSTAWQIYSLITDVYRPIPDRLKDWITTPKSNGYESLHTTVIGPQGRYVEIQIRSERMDDVAERGFAAHWKYKGVSTQRDHYEPLLDSIRDLIDGGSGSATEFLNDFKSNMSADEVYVLTPKGDLVNLPKGATALDFAFSVHSMVGYHCQAVKVNNRVVPMGTVLQNGDRVQVITSKKQRPNESWLKMVTTGKARSKIRNSLKEEKRRVGELGKESLLRKLANRKVRIEPAIELLLRHYKFSSRVDLFYAIATKTLLTSEIFKTFEVSGNKLVLRPEVQAAQVKPAAPDTAQPVKRPRAARAGIAPQLLVNDEPADQYNYSFATCCNPVQGDAIFGYLSGTNSLKIHRVQCSNAEHLLSNHGYRVFKARWGMPGTHSFVTSILIKGIDKGRGVLERITNELSRNQGLDLRGMNIQSDQGFFTCHVQVVVANTKQIEMAVRALAKLDAVTSVQRDDLHEEEL